MIKVVFDSVVFVRCLLNPDSFWGQLIFQNFHLYRLFISRSVAMEILEVLQRPELKNKFRSLKGRDVKRVLEIISEAEVVDIGAVPAISRDPKDDKFLVTAQAANADYLVTADKDLLDLKMHEGIEIIDAEAFLEILNEKTGY